MKTISTALDEHFGQDVTTVATCWKITRQDSVEIGYTDHDVEIVYDGVTYRPKTNISSVQQGSKGGVDNLDLYIPFENVALLKADVKNGLYDGAILSVFMLNYEDTTQGIVKILKGSFGNPQLTDIGASVEFDSISGWLTKSFIDVFSYECPERLGNTKCGITLATYTVSGTIATVTDNANFTASGSLIGTDGYYEYGVITWTSGNNNGSTIEIKEYIGASKTIETLLDTTFNIQVGDTFSIVAGCDKYFETCKDKFNNVVNFRGFPHIPGEDKLLLGSASAISSASARSTTQSGGGSTPTYYQ